jgi:small subunit ribosomal protein S1
LTAFGAFVNLRPGIDGLMHISKLGRGRRIAHPRDAVKLGDTLEVKIDAVDPGKKRISLSFAPAETEDPVTVKVVREPEDSYRDYMGNTPTTLGSLGDLLKRKLDRKE